MVGARSRTRWFGARGVVSTGSVPVGSVPAGAVSTGAVPVGSVSAGVDGTGALPAGVVPSSNWVKAAISRRCRR